MHARSMGEHMSSTKVTYIFQLTTQPADPALAVAHSGGWTESYWQPNAIPSNFPLIGALATKRAALLGKGAAIVGVRVGQYTLSVNKWLPQGASTGPLFRPGVQGNPTDIPQMALLCGSTSSAGPNQAKFTLRGIPDEVVTNGEYNPYSGYKTFVTNFFKELSDNAWSFSGRVIANPTYRIQQIVASTTPGWVTLLMQTSPYVSGGYLRLLHVRDDDGNPLKGAFAMKQFDNTVPSISIAVPDATVRSLTGGFGRYDQIGLFPLTNPVVRRVGVRKVGRPYESYRGRASKRR